MAVLKNGEGEEKNDERLIDLFVGAAGKNGSTHCLAKSIVFG